MDIPNITGNMKPMLKTHYFPRKLTNIPWLKRSLSSTQKCPGSLGDLWVPNGSAKKPRHETCRSHKGCWWPKWTSTVPLVRKEVLKGPEKVGLVRDQFFVACMRDVQKFEFMIVVLKWSCHIGILFGCFHNIYIYGRFRLDGLRLLRCVVANVEHFFFSAISWETSWNDPSVWVGGKQRHGNKPSWR